MQTLINLFKTAVYPAYIYDYISRRLSSTPCTTGNMTSITTIFYTYDSGAVITISADTTTETINTEPVDFQEKAENHPSFDTPYSAEQNTAITAHITITPNPDMLYYGYRFYAPSLGRWVSRDPGGESGGKNLLAFVNNSPPIAFDRYGLKFTWIWEEADWHHRFHSKPSGNKKPGEPAGRVGTGGIAKPETIGIYSAETETSFLTCCWLKELRYDVTVRMNRLRWDGVSSTSIYGIIGYIGDNPVYMTNSDWLKMEQHEETHRQEFEQLYNDIIEPMLERAKGCTGKANAKIAMDASACLAKIEAEVRQEKSIDEFWEKFRRANKELDDAQNIRTEWNNADNNWYATSPW